jgi:hypothetical protein
MHKLALTDGTSCWYCLALQGADRREAACQVGGLHWFIAGWQSKPQAIPLAIQLPNSMPVPPCKHGWARQTLLWQGLQKQDPWAAATKYSRGTAHAKLQPSTQH